MASNTPPRAAHDAIRYRGKEVHHMPINGGESNALGSGQELIVAASVSEAGHTRRTPDGATMPFEVDGSKQSTSGVQCKKSDRYRGPACKPALTEEQERPKKLLFGLSDKRSRRSGPPSIVDVGTADYVAPPNTDEHAWRSAQGEQVGGAAPSAPLEPSRALLQPIKQLGFHTETGQMRHDLAVGILKFYCQRLKKIESSPLVDMRSKKAAEVELSTAEDLLQSLSQESSPGVSLAQTQQVLSVTQAILQHVYRSEPFLTKVKKKLLGWLPKTKAIRDEATKYLAVADVDPLFKRILNIVGETLPGTVAALQRPMVEERVLEEECEGYDQAGRSKSTFIKGGVSIPFHVVPGVAAGASVDVTPYEKELQVLDDTTLLESRAFSFRAAAQLILGLPKFLLLKLGFKLSIGLGIKKMWGKNYEDVRHAIRDPDGYLHHQSVRLDPDHSTRSTASHQSPKVGFFRKLFRPLFNLFQPLFNLFKRLFYRLRGIETRSLRNLDDSQYRAQAQHDNLTTWMAHVMESVDAKEQMVSPETDRPSSPVQKEEVPIDRPPAQEKIRPRYVVTNHQRPPMVGLPGSFNIITGTLSQEAAASAGVAGIAMATAGQAIQGDISKIKFFGLTSFGSAANDPSTEKEATRVLQKFCDKQSLTLSMFCPRELSIVPSLGPHEQTLSQWIAHASLAQLERFMSAMEIQFDLYCFSRRQGGSNQLALEPAQAIEKSLKIASRGNAQYQYVRILTVLNELCGLRLKALSVSNDASSQENLFEKLGRKLASPDIPNDRYNRKTAQEFCSFSEIVRMTEYAGEFKREVEITTGLGSKLGVSMMARLSKRTDANLLRRGLFLSSTLSFSGNQRIFGDIGGVKVQLLPILIDFYAPQGVSPGAIMESLQSLELSSELGTHFTIVWNFYKPFEDASFARQYTRYIYDYTASSAMQYFAKVSSLSREDFVKKEELGTDTLSYLALLHHTWATQSELPAGVQSEPPQATRWETLGRDKKDVFQQVFINLADPHHPLHKEMDGYIDEVRNCKDWTQRFKDLVTQFRGRGMAEDAFTSRMAQCLQPLLQNDNVDFQQEYWTFFKRSLVDSAANFKAKFNASPSDSDAIEEARLAVRDLLDALLLAHAAVWRGSYQNKKLSLKINPRRSFFS